MSYINYKAVLSEPETVATLAIEVMNPEFAPNSIQMDESVNNWISEVCPELANASYSYTSTDFKSIEVGDYTYYIKKTHYGVAIFRRSGRFITFPINF